MAFTRSPFFVLGAPDKYVFAFLPIDVSLIDSILRGNLCVGPNAYLYEYPLLRPARGRGSLICQVLLGREYVSSSDCPIPSGFHSRIVRPFGPERGRAIIVENSDQILPRFVIHLNEVGR